MAFPNRPERRIFTLAQARRMLPEVAATVTVMVRRVRRARQLGALRQSLQRSAGSDGAPVEADEAALDAELERLQAQVEQLIEYIRNLGVEIKDLDRGLVDWVALREGREVYLCWQHGEQAIAHWHELNAGFAGRQPIIPEEWT